MKQGIYFLAVGLLTLAAGVLARVYNVWEDIYAVDGLALLLGGVLAIAGIGRMIAARLS